MPFDIVLTREGTFAIEIDTEIYPYSVSDSSGGCNTECGTEIVIQTESGDEEAFVNLFCLDQFEESDAFLDCNHDRPYIDRDYTI